MNENKLTWGEQLSGVLQQSRQLYSYDDICHSLDSIAAAITEDMADLHPVALTVMQGGLIFAGHLTARLRFPLEMDYIHASRYGGKLEGSQLKWLARPAASVEGRHVLLLDDIFDQGFTLQHLVHDCLEQGAASVRSAVLLTKEHEREMADYKPDYSALTVEDLYVYGFGMDFEHQLRNLDCIYAYEPE